MLSGQSNVIGVQRGKWIPLLERTTELRIFLHLLCASIYAESLTQYALSRRLWGMNYADLAAIPYGIIVIGVVGYFGLMGLVLPLLHATFRYFAFRLVLGSEKEQGIWGKIDGMVHRSEILKAAYKTKDYEPVRLLEAHRKRCQENRQGLRTLGKLAFASIILLLGSGFLVRGGYFWALITWVEILAGNLLAYFTMLIVIAPLSWLIYADLQDDQDRDEYLYFPPLYYQLQKPVHEAFPEIKGCP